MTKWGLDSEITKADEKRGRGDNFTPFQLLELYAEGEGWAGHLYQEFADATKGTVSFSWSPRPNKRYDEIGLRARLGLGDDLSDQELAEAEQERGKQIELFIFTDEQFQKIMYSNRRGVIGDMLVIAERGREALLLWLWQCFKIKQECFKIGPDIDGE